MTMVKSGLKGLNGSVNTIIKAPGMHSILLLNNTYLIYELLGCTIVSLVSLFVDFSFCINVLLPLHVVLR